MSGTLQPFLAPLAPLGETPAASDTGPAPAPAATDGGSSLQPFLPPLIQLLQGVNENLLNKLRDSFLDVTSAILDKTGAIISAAAPKLLGLGLSLGDAAENLPKDLSTLATDYKNADLSHAVPGEVLATDVSAIGADVLTLEGGAEIGVGALVTVAGAATLDPLAIGVGIGLIEAGVSTIGVASIASTIAQISGDVEGVLSFIGSSLQPILAPLAPLGETPAASDTNPAVAPAATDDGSSLQPILAPLAPLIVSPPDTSVTIPDTTLGGSDTNPAVAPAATDDGSSLQPILAPLAPLDVVPGNNTLTPTIPVVSSPDTSVTIPDPTLGNTTPVGFDGDQVSLTTYSPNIAPGDIIGAGSATVMPGTTTFQSFAALENGANGTRLTDGSLTLSGDTMTFLYSPSEEGTAFYSAPFTGYDIQTAGSDPAITAASIISTNIPGLTAADLSFSDHTVDLNVAGLTLPRDAPGSIVLGFSFAGQSPDVLTPVHT